MRPLNDEELVLVRGMIAQHQADKARTADQRTDDNLEILALRDELALVKSEAAQREAQLETEVKASRDMNTMSMKVTEVAQRRLETALARNAQLLSENTELLLIKEQWEEHQ